MYGVIVFSEDYGDDAAAAFVVAPDILIVLGTLGRWFTRAELDSDPETSWLPEGCWCVDRNDERVKDFPPG